MWNEIEVGRVDVRPGPIFASSDAFTITMTSTGGHGAMPHQTSDPVLASAQLIVALQSLVSRETPPLEPAVLTIGSIHGGTAPNIIPIRIEMQGTLRVFDPDVRERLLARIGQMIESVATTFRVKSELRMTDSCPACINNPDMADFTRRVAEGVLSSNHVFSRQRTLAADDMSLFLDAVPGCYFFVGAANASRGLDAPHHSPGFDFDERAMEIGTEVLTSVALEFLERG